jgi:hypothetical protein
MADGRVTSARHRNGSSPKYWYTYPSVSVVSPSFPTTPTSRQLTNNNNNNNNRNSNESSLVRRNYIPLAVFLVFSFCMINAELAFQRITQSTFDSQQLQVQVQVPVHVPVLVPVLVPVVLENQNQNHHQSTPTIQDTPTTNETLPLPMPTTKTFGGVPSRPFHKWPSTRPLPCFDPNEVPGVHWTSKQVQLKPITKGLIYIKLVKTGSSTASGVHLRLARGLARRVRVEHSQNINTTNSNTTNSSNYEICRSRFLHGWAGPKMLRLAARDRQSSFLWSIVRDPTRRFVSDFFHFQVSRRNVTPTVSNMKSYFEISYKHKHHYLDWLSITGYKYEVSDPIRKAKHIIKNYDFIGVVERLDESLVVLAMLLDIPLGDVLYLDSKRSGGYDDGEKEKTCYFIQPANVTSDMATYLASDAWRRYIEPEERLFQATNHSLDLTMDGLGRDAVYRQLEIFKKAQAVVQAKCLNSTRFPCSATGELRNASDVDCWTRDMGCGFDCLDQVAIDLGIAE